MTTRVDHLVVAAADLEQGVAWCQATLGVTPGPGGRHALFGTHNRLLKIASATFPEAYLEIIAIDPAAAAPGRPRWFGLDEPALRSALASGPRLLHLVARTTTLEPLRLALMVAGLAPGEPVRASRATAAGLLEWEILLRADGQLLCAGALPTLIQWRGPHPTAAMAASGVQLRAVSLRGLNERVRQTLRLDCVKTGSEAGPALSAWLDTPLGPVILESA